MSDHAEWMARAVETCRHGIAAGQSPFGALIARSDGDIVCATSNTVRSNRDPTAHAEINAIREASRILGTIDLSGHTMVATCEPCPMCAAAIHWARLDAVIFGASIEDARAAGFHELTVPIEQLYRLGRSEVALIPGVLRDQCRHLFEEWRNGPHPEPY